MKKVNKLNMLAGLGVLIFVGGLLSFYIPQDKKPKPWDVPAEFKNKKNPIAADKSSVNTGKMLYMKNCASCHGRMGKGDGPKARNLEAFPGDFTMAEYQKQTDGEMHYKTVKGRDDMPSYEGKIPDEDIWHIVNYIRTFDD
jgi:mono/diheme cytochrome c family protein